MTTGTHERANTFTDEQINQFLANRPARKAAADCQLMFSRSKTSAYRGKAPLQVEPASMVPAQPMQFDRPLPALVWGYSWVTDKHSEIVRR